ncbi:MAG: translocation/assembly module TamB domain-containing protein [Haliea sp.]|nr:translocation/assembly module TamB domain-containing protein [Haliea sp.]
MKKLAGAFLLLLLSLLIAAMTLPFTSLGTQLLLRLVPASSPLQVAYRGGSLGGELRLASLQLTLDGLLVEITDVRSRLRLSCLWESLFCVDTLEVARVAVTVAARDGNAAADEAADSSPLEMIQLPMSLRAPGVKIGSVVVQWPGGAWQQAATQLDLQLAPDGVYLDALTIYEAELSLQPGEPAPPVTMMLPTLELPLTLAVDGMTLVNPRVKVGELVEQFDALVGALRWRGARLDITQLKLEQEGRGEVVAHGHVLMAEGWPLELALSAAVSAPSLPTVLNERQVEVVLAGEPNALSLEAKVSGEPRLVLFASADLLAPKRPFRASAQFTGEAPLRLAELQNAPPALADAALVWPLELTAKGDSENQALSLQGRLRDVGYQVLDIVLTARNQPGVMRVDELQVSAGDQGSVSLAGSLHYADGYQWEAQLESPRLVLPRLSEYVFGEVAGQLATAGHFDAAGWHLDLQNVDLKGKVNGLPALLKGDLQLDSADLIRSGDLRAQVNGAEIEVFADDARAGEVRAELGIADLGRWSHDAGGSVLVNAEWQRQRNRIELRGSVQSVHWNSLRAARGIIEGSVALGDAPQGQGVLRLDQLELGAVALDALSLRLEGSAEAAELSLTSEGAVAGTLQATVGSLAGGWQAQVNSTRFETPLGALLLNKPVQGRFEAGGGRVSAHCWQLAESELCTSEVILGATGGGEAQLAGDLTLFAALLPQQVEARGPLSADFLVAWAPGTALRVQSKVASPGGSITQFYPEGESAMFVWDALDATFSQGGSGLSLQAALQRTGETRLVLNLQLPAESAGALEGDLTLNGLQISALGPFLPQLEQLEGQLSGRVALSGTLDKPLANGGLRWSEGLVVLEANPTEIDALDLRMTFNGESANLAGSARLGGGPLSMTGEAELGDEPYLALSFLGSNNRLLYPPSTQLDVSPDLRLRVTPGGIEARGEVVVHEGVFAYEELPAGSVTLSDDIVEVDYAGNSLAVENPLRLDASLRVRINDRLRVRGKDLNVTVGGDLSLRQAPERPLQLFGNLNIIGGEFRAYGQRLLVRQGRIAFTGVPENPDLNLRAEREIPVEDVRAGVTVTGTLEQPELRVYSEPMMSQTEALSYLLRGRGLDSGAGADGTAMALSLGTGLVNRSVLVEELNKVPGLRNVEFGTDGSEDDTAATVSGYIGERIYLSYGVGLYEPINVLTARLYLQARLWLEVVSRLESSIDLYYSFDID